MPVERPKKNDHLLIGEVAKSSSKAGIWFGEANAFKSRQKKILTELQDQIDWLKLPNAILAISQDPHGIVVIAPNPSLPGIIVLADGTTKSNTAKLQEKYTRLVAAATEKTGTTALTSSKRK